MRGVNSEPVTARIDKMSGAWLEQETMSMKYYQRKSEELIILTLGLTVLGQ